MILSRVLIQIVLECKTRCALLALKRALLLDLFVRAPVRLKRRFAVKVAVALSARKRLHRGAVRVRQLDVLAPRSQTAELAPAKGALLPALSSERVVAPQVQSEVEPPRKALAAASHRALDRAAVPSLVLRQPLALKEGLAARGVVAQVDPEAVLRQTCALSVDAVDAVVSMDSHLVLQQLRAVMTDVTADGTAFDWTLHNHKSEKSENFPQEMMLRTFVSTD